MKQVDKIIVKPDDFKNLKFDVKVTLTNESKETCHCGCDCGLECGVHRE